MNKQNQKQKYTEHGEHLDQRHMATLVHFILP